MPSSRELKTSARQLIRISKPNVIAVGTVYCILGIVISMLASQLIYGNVTQANYEQLLNYMNSGATTQALRVLENMMPSGGAVLLYVLLELCSMVVAVGFDIFLLRTVRGNNPSFGNLLDGFGFFWRILLLNVLTGLFISLWSLLFIIPGVIAALSYSQATLILIDHPEFSVMECIRASKNMMRGHKGELFWLELSFIGWSLLVSLSSVPGLWFFSGLQVWTVPYMSMTFVLYYEVLRTGRLWNQGPTGPELPPM